MDLKPGGRWKSAVCDTELVVVRPPKGPATLECGGHPVIAHGAARPEGLALAAAGPTSAAGKRYNDAETGLEALCTRSGAGALSVDGRPLEAVGAKKLPSSD